jgi:hypothetical protein
MSDRWSRPLAVGLALLFVAELMWLAAGGSPIVTVDYDRANYMAAVTRYLGSGTPYMPAEVAAPFDYSRSTFLHPPIALYLMVPFSFLPDILWYLVPLAIVAWSIWAWRPAPWALALVALCLAWPRTPSAILNGNTDLWVAAFVALGLRLGWPAVLALIKPSLAPVALVGIRKRSWWFAGAGLIAAWIPFGSLWWEWTAVVLNAPGGWLYSAFSLPYTLVPLVAWWGRQGERRQVGSSHRFSVLGLGPSGR